MDERRFLSSNRCLRNCHGSKVEEGVEEQGSKDKKTGRGREIMERKKKRNREREK